jgi:endonuclease/exonuclease/phosphatase family metal-dependent hydrolase
LSVASEILIDAQRYVRGSNEFTTSIISLLRSTGRSLLRSTVFSSIHPFIKKIKHTSEPAGKVAIRYSPAWGNDSRPDHELTIISANLCHGWPNQENLLQRLESFAQLVEKQQADIILLQEVSRSSKFKVDDWLSNRLGMAYVYSRANGHQSIGFEEGVAIFSRFPIEAPYLKEFSNGLNPFVRRVALGAFVDTPIGRMPFFSVHLGITPHENAAQLINLHQWVHEITGSQPALIGGDFNAHETTPQIRYAQGKWVDIFRQIHPEKDAATHEIRWPWGGLLRRSRLDYIFLKAGEQNWQVLEAQLLDSPNGPYSDHRAVLTRIMPI